MPAGLEQSCGPLPYLLIDHGWMIKTRVEASSSDEVGYFIFYQRTVVRELAQPRSPDILLHSLGRIGARNGNLVPLGTSHATRISAA
jgi:hypothetical protein